MKQWERDGKPVLVVHALLKSCEHFKFFLNLTVQELYAENCSLITQCTLASIFTLSICLKDKKCSSSSTSWTQFLARNRQATLSPYPSLFQFTSASLLFLWPVSEAIAGNKAQKNSNRDDLRVMFPPSHFEEVLGVTCDAGQCSAKVDNLSLSPVVGEEARGMPSLQRVVIAQRDSHSCSAPNVNMDSPIHHWPYFLSTHPGERDDLVPAAGISTVFP